MIKTMQINMKNLDSALNVVCDDISTQEATNIEFQSDLEQVQKDASNVIKDDKTINDVRDIIDSLNNDGYSDNGIDDYDKLYDTIYDYDRKIMALSY